MESVCVGTTVHPSSRAAPTYIVVFFLPPFLSINLIMRVFWLRVLHMLRKYGYSCYGMR